MVRNFRKPSSKKPLKKRRFYRTQTSSELKSWLIVESKQGCRLPSCSKQEEPEKLTKHHWGYRGERENPVDNPAVIHLLCPPCQDRVHKIAAVAIIYLEILLSVKLEVLIQKVAEFLGETFENVKFVLKEELKPAGLVQIKKGRCKLLERGTRRIANIKEYLEINSPELARELKRAFQPMKS